MESLEGPCLHDNAELQNQLWSTLQECRKQMQHTHICILIDHFPVKTPSIIFSTLPTPDAQVYRVEIPRMNFRTNEMALNIAKYLKGKMLFILNYVNNINCVNNMLPWLQIFLQRQGLLENRLSTKLISCILENLRNNTNITVSPAEEDIYSVNNRKS